MDPIGHFLIGSAVFAMAPNEAGAAVATAVLVSAEAPDIDIVVRWFKGHPAYLRHHRGPTHGPIGVLLLCTLIALVLALFTATDFGTLWSWALAGALSHVIFDVTNNYGTQALWPFNRTRLALDWSPVVDVWLMALIGGGWLVHWLLPGAPRQTIFAVVWGLITLYYATRWYLHRRAGALVVQRFAAALPPGAPGVQYSVHPLFLSLYTWRYVVQEEERFLTGLVCLRRGVVTPPTAARHVRDAVINASLQSTMLDIFLEFARHPRADYTVDSFGQYTVRWTDMRFEVDGFSPFTAEVYLDKELRLLDDKLGAQSAPDKEYLRKRWREERGILDHEEGILS